MKFSIYFIFSFLLFANTHLHAKHKPNINGLKQEGTSSSLYSPKNTNGISYDTAILVKWPLNKNGQFNVAGIVIGKLVNNKFVVNRTRIKVQSINIPQKLGDILTDNTPIVFEKMVGGVSQGAGVPMDTAILIKWPPLKSGNKFTTVSSMVTGYIQDGDFLFVQQGNRLIPTIVGKYGDILIDDVPIPPYDTPNGRVTNDGISSTNPGQVERRAGGGEPEKPKGCYCVEEPTPGTFTGVNVDCPGGDCVKCCADLKKQGGTGVPVPAEVALAISKGQYTGDWGDKNYYFNEVKPKQETTTLSQISTNWDKTKYPYGIVVFNNSQYDYDKAENILEWMKDSKNLNGKSEMPVPVFIVPVMPKDTARREKHHAAFNKKRREQGFGKMVGLIPPPNNTPFFPEIVYRENTRLVKCTDADGNDYYVNCPEGTENCCGLAPLPQIDLTTPAENNGNPDGGTKPKPGTTTLSGIFANWDKTKNPYGIVVFKNSQFVYDKAENIQEWMKGFKKLKGKKEKGYEAFYIIPTTPKDTTIQAANGAGTRLAAGNASTKPGLKRIEIVSPPNNSPSSPEIIYDANTRLVKCTDADGNDYYVNCPEGTGNCCDLAPLPFIDLTSPEKQESFGSGNNHPDSTMSFKWPEDFNNSAYKDLKFEPNAILIGKDGKKHDVKFDSHSNYRFVVFKDISTDYTFLKMPAGTLFLKPFNGTYEGFNKPSIFVTMPQGSVKANGAGTRLATSQASAKPGLKRLTPPPAPIGATVPLGEVIFKNNGGGIKIDTAIVIYWPLVNGKDDYRQTAPPEGSTIFYPEASIAAIQKAPSGTILHYTQTNMTNLGSNKDDVFTTVYKYGDILIDDVPIPFERIQNPSKIPSTDTAIIVKWPEDFKKAAYQEASFEAMATFVAADGKFYFIDLDSDGDGFFDVDELASKIPAGTMLLKRGATRKNTQPFIFVTMPQGSVKANGAGTRLATSQASNKPGLKRLTPPPAPIGATVPLGEILFKNNGGGIKIDTAIVIFWPPVNGKDDYKQIPPPNNNMVVFSGEFVQNIKSEKVNSGDRHGQLVLSRRRAKLLLTWQGLIRTNSDNDNDEYNVAESINDAKSLDKSNLGVAKDTIQVIKWPEDFKKAVYKESSYEAMATFVSADGKFYFIDLDSDGDGFFDVDELASKIPAGTMLLKRGAKTKTANKSNFHTVSFTKNGDTLPTYTMQIALPNGSSMDKLFEMSDQAQIYKMREIISLHIGQAGRQTTNNEKDIPIALPYFDTNGNLLFWATKDAITLTYEKNAVNISSIAKNNKYDMDTFKSFYKTLINDNPTFAYPQFKKDRLRAVPHTELSIDPKLGKQRK
jgi:hypothetical protein